MLMSEMSIWSDVFGVYGMETLQKSICVLNSAKVNLCFLFRLCTFTVTERIYFLYYNGTVIQ